MGAQAPQSASAVPADRRRKTIVSTESIASQPRSIGAPEPCARCGAPLAEDQRYCLECGERRTPTSSVLAGGPPSASAARGQPVPPPPDRSGTASGEHAGRGGAVTVIAGVGVLLLAMGVGVLIGRSGGSKQAAAPAQVISVASPGAGDSTTSTPDASSFADDWPSGTNGFTVKLQTLPQASTRTGAVEAAKTAAGAKGAKGVGALKSEDFSSLTAGNYVIYSGVYHKKGEADRALKGLEKSFPDASVIKVSTSGGRGAVSGGSGGASPGGSGGGASSNHPAPPSVVEHLNSTKGQGGKSGKSYEEESKNLPNVISTG
jgi:hypothetical protein